MELKEALETLDTMNDEHWTADGAPKVDVLKEMTGNKDLSRQDIMDAAPQFSRENPVVEVTPPEEEPKDDTTPEVGDVSREVNPVDPAEAMEALQELFEDGELPDGQQFSSVLLKITDGEDLDNIFKGLKAREQELYSSIEDVKKQAQAMGRLALLAQKRRDYVAPPPSEQEQRMAFIKKQGEVRAAKAARLSGFDVKALAKLDPRSPLDQAMAAKRARGQNRPSRV